MSFQKLKIHMTRAALCNTSSGSDARGLSLAGPALAAEANKS